MLRCYRRYAATSYAQKLHQRRIASSKCCPVLPTLKTRFLSSIQNASANSVPVVFIPYQQRFWTNSAVPSERSHLRHSSIFRDGLLPHCNIDAWCIRRPLHSFSMIPHSQNWKSSSRWLVGDQWMPFLCAPTM